MTWWVGMLSRGETMECSASMSIEKVQEGDYVLWAENK
jgi:hypothetical protein